MKKILIVLNHQPKIPPFMLTALNCAKERYDEVHYVNTKYPQFADLYSKDKNVHFSQPNALERKTAILRAIFSFFTPIVLSDFYKCIKEKGFHLHILKIFLRGLSADECIRPIAVKIIDKYPQERITVLSTWLSACAFSAAQLKRKHGNIKAVSMAHSYEILISRNPLVRYQFVDFKHKYLDGIYFIANTVRQMYIDGVGPMAEDYLNRMHVCHLGSYKASSNLNKTEPDVFNVCSCSRVIPLKRIDVLIDALRGWKYGKLCWTHMGNGVIFDEIKVEAEKLQNPMVQINLKGFVPNSEVEEYYANNPVDVFVNLSSIEGLPISIMEAVSYGIPVIATDVGGTKEIVTPEVGVLLPGDITPQKVLNALREFYEKSETERNTLRNSAYGYWKKHFDAANNLNLLFDQIDSI